ncbi:hypothetical protein ACJIZ3_022318 [Penstemon smallii]|uniref:WRKY19-like zinc finger domain-containing protein n=1 Tax=Penstemon smallii TaxID=265156 RepID=A0ABD3TN10_9LAMI
MDGTPGYSSTLALASKDLGTVNDYAVVSALDFDAAGLSSFCASNGGKRKCSAIDRPFNYLKDGSSLVLGLGRSSSSCTTICLGKEIEEDSSIDLGLNFNLNIGNNRLSNRKKISAGTLNALKIRKPILDLQLSLSTVPAESDVTTVTQGLLPCQNYSDSTALAPTVQLGDEGSTSSRWKAGALFAPLPYVEKASSLLAPLLKKKAGPSLTPLQNVEISIPFNQGHTHVNPDQLSPNISSTAEATPSSISSQRKTSVKTCRFGGCTRGARGASGLCISHGGGRRCQRAGCQKGAEGKTVFCKAHGGGRRCQHLGCTKSAEGRTDYCIGHGGGRRCSHEGCSRASRGKSGLCIRHGGGKRCTVENCTKSAEGISGLCISHGGGRRCQYPECTKGAQGSTMFCKAHGGGRRCTFLGCTKGAEGSTPFCKGHGGGKRCTSEGCTKSVHGGTLFCVSHGGGKRCAIPECTKSARGRTSYCVRHGGGKRCKFEGCGKSAQGSTDFCKAHGGGKRCSWGQSGSGLYGPGLIPCDKFARGRSGLCAAHSAQMQESQVNSSSTTQEPDSSMSTQMKDIFVAGNPDDSGTTSFGSIGYVHHMISQPIMPLGNVIVGNSKLDPLCLPEGRVHGGGLMAMLRGGAAFSNNNQEGNTGPLEPYRLPHRWV